MKKGFILFLLFFLIFGLANNVFAIEVDYPSIPGAEPPQVFLEKIKSGVYSEDFYVPLLLKYIYHLILALSGFACLAVGLSGLVLYLISSGSVERMREAQTRFSLGLTGLVILFSSYVIVSIINPQALFLSLGINPLPGTRTGGLAGSLIFDYYVEVPLGLLIEDVTQKIYEANGLSYQIWVAAAQQVECPADPSQCPMWDTQYWEQFSTVTVPSSQYFVENLFLENPYSLESLKPTLITKTNGKDDSDKDDSDNVSFLYALLENPFWQASTAQAQVTCRPCLQPTIFDVRVESGMIKYKVGIYFPCPCSDCSPYAHSGIGDVGAGPCGNTGRIQVIYPPFWESGDAAHAPSAPATPGPHVLCFSVKPDRDVDPSCQGQEKSYSCVVMIGNNSEIISTDCQDGPIFPPPCPPTRIVPSLKQLSECLDYLSDLCRCNTTDAGLNSPCDQPGCTGACLGDPCNRIFPSSQAPGGSVQFETVCNQYSVFETYNSVACDWFSVSKDASRNADASNYCSQGEICLKAMINDTKDLMQKRINELEGLKQRATKLSEDLEKSMLKLKLAEAFLRDAPFQSPDGEIQPIQRSRYIALDGFHDGTIQTRRILPWRMFNGEDDEATFYISEKGAEDLIATVESLWRIIDNQGVGPSPGPWTTCDAATLQTYINNWNGVKANLTPALESALDNALSNSGIDIRKALVLALISWESGFQQFPCASSPPCNSQAGGCHGCYRYDMCEAIGCNDSWWETENCGKFQQLWNNIGGGIAATQGYTINTVPVSAAGMYQGVHHCGGAMGMAQAMVYTWEGIMGLNKDPWNPANAFEFVIRKLERDGGASAQTCYAEKMSVWQYVGAVPGTAEHAACITQLADYIAQNETGEDVCQGGNPAGCIINGPYESNPSSNYDLNTTLKARHPVANPGGLMSISGNCGCPKPPDLSTTFPTLNITNAWQVNDTAQPCFNVSPCVHLAGITVGSGYEIRVPEVGFEIAPGLNAAVIYADNNLNLLSLHYTANDDVSHGYTVQFEGIHVRDDLFDAYNEANSVTSRACLPVVQNGDIVGTAVGNEITVIVRDRGNWMNPLSAKDWWNWPNGCAGCGD